MSIHIRARTAVTAVLALAAAAVLGTAPAFAALSDVGPADPATGLPSYYQDDTGVLSASLNYDVSRNLSLHFDALNLNDPILKMYGANTDQPRAFYSNGRQYYFTVRVKF